MLNILALSPVSQGKEQEPAPQEVQITPSEDGIFRDTKLMGGVNIEVDRSDQEGAVLKIHFERGEYDAWIGGIRNGSMVNWAMNQIASKLLNGKHLPPDFDQRITLTDFNLPTGRTVEFSVMEKYFLGEPRKSGDKNWKKLSDIQLSYTP